MSNVLDSVPKIPGLMSYFKKFVLLWWGGRQEKELLGNQRKKTVYKKIYNWIVRCYSLVFRYTVFKLAQDWSQFYHYWLWDLGEGNWLNPLLLICKMGVIIIIIHYNVIMMIKISFMYIMYPTWHTRLMNVSSSWLNVRMKMVRKVTEFILKFCC